MKKATHIIVLLLITLFVTTPITNAAIHAVENFGLDRIEKSSDTDKLSKELREGFRLSKEGKDQEAFKMFTAAAKRDELIAYLVLGVMHREGRGTPQNLKLAKENFKKAADKGSPQAAEELVLLRFTSPDTKEELAAARTQLEKFAKEGMAVAQLRLGLAHLAGYGYPADEAKAIEYLTQAAKSTGPFKSEAAYALGQLYRKGSPKLAETWIKKAAEQKHLGAMRALGEFYLDSDPEKQNYSKAREWFIRLHKQGDPHGFYYLGQMDENGWGGEKSPESAADFYRKAADKKVPAALFRLANYHEYGLGGLKKDEKKATELYRQGAELGHSICMYNLSVLLDKEGKDSPLKAEVMTWLLRAASAGLVEAEYQIGLRYQQGRGVQQDFVAAAAWFDRASRNDHSLSQLHLGEMYEKGLGVKANNTSARKLFQLSAKGGNLGGMIKYAQVLANGIGGKQDLPEAYVFAEKALKASKPETPGAKLTSKLRDDIIKAMTAEQLAEGKKRLSAPDKKQP